MRMPSYCCFRSARWLPTPEGEYGKALLNVENTVTPLVQPRTAALIWVYPRLPDVGSSCRRAALSFAARGEMLPRVVEHAQAVAMGGDAMHGSGLAHIK
jgi:hypothetical protein